MFTRKHRTFLSSSGERNIYPYHQHVMVHGLLVYKQNGQISLPCLLMYEANLSFSHDLNIPFVSIHGMLLSRSLSWHLVFALFKTSSTSPSPKDLSTKSDHGPSSCSTLLCHVGVCPQLIRFSFTVKIACNRLLTAADTINHNSPKTP